MTEQNISTIVADKVSDLVAQDQKTHLLDEIIIYGLSEKDGSAIITFDWEGVNAFKLAQEMAEFFSYLKNIILSLGKETVEQIAPDIFSYGNSKDGVITKITYRFRIWPSAGNYESFKRLMLEK